jgi:hypothetical protein
MMHTLTARNLAGMLAAQGADIESAFLELAAVAPALNIRVRRELFRDEVLPRLRNGHITGYSAPRWVCAMHAADQLVQLVGDSALVQYLQVKFPEYTL